MPGITTIEYIAHSEQDTMALAMQIASAFPRQGIIYLSGDLGAGKTSWVRGFLQGLGYRGQVKSPTYTLVEQYTVAKRVFYHFDLYRLTDPRELMELGMRDYLEENTVCIVEWPERGGSVLPMADLECHFDFIEQGRRLRLQANTDGGQASLQKVL